MANNKKGGYGINLTSGGTPFLLGFIALAVGFGLLFTRGITPSSTLTSPGDQSEYEIVPETPVPGQGLQLKTLKFKACSQTAAVDMLLDRSGSMSGSKMDQLKAAATTFTANLSDDSIVGIQSFSSFSPGDNNITNDVPIGRYGDIKPQVTRAISSLRAFGNTPTRDALTFSLNLLTQAVPKYPDKKFAFIFVSDGEPVPGQGQDGDEDPRDGGTNPASSIRALGVTVYTIAIGANSTTMQQVMSSIASGPDKQFYAPSGSELQNIYKQIASKICDTNS